VIGIPGIGVPVSILESTMTALNELQIAQAMAAGELSSPQKLGNLAFYKMRITGTGRAFRRGDDDKIKDEYVFRDPEIYLNQNFLDRCQGLPVIFEHPAGKVLDSDEFRARMVGTLVCPFILGSEVWAVARIYDADTILILDNENMSTSPCVVFSRASGNRRIGLSDGSVLLIEGEPSLLDHLAICEQGVWDRGQAPYGVISETAI
jgi:hypothetical protein